LSGKRRFVLAARDAADRQVPQLLGDVVKRAEGVGREQTDVDGWAQLLDRMTAAVAMAGGIDGIVDAAG
jgi:hypothetical protein